MSGLASGSRRLEQAALALGGVAVGEVCGRLVAALGVEASREDDVAVLAVQYLSQVGPELPSRLSGPRRGVARAPYGDARMDGRPWRRPSPSGIRCCLAVGEACANAVEHAYRDGAAGDVHVDIAEDADRSLAVSIRDFGRFCDRSSSSDDRGRGTDIMRRLTTEFARDSTLSGTTVRFRLPMDVPTSA